MKLINPTGKGIRNDSRGLGHHGAPRGHRRHDGVDLMCDPGQSIFMPVDGIITRVSMPYKDDKRWLGAYIISPRIEIKMWYFVPNLFGMELKAGTVIGTAQDIGEKYEGVTPHIHLRICKIDPMLLLSETDEELYGDVLKGGIMKKLSVALMVIVVFLAGCISLQVGDTEKELVAKIAARHVGYEIQHKYPDIAMKVNALCQEITTQEDPDLIKIAINSIAIELTEEINDPLLVADIYDLMGLINFDVVEITESQMGIIKAVATGLSEGIEFKTIK